MYNLFRKNRIRFLLTYTLFTLFLSGCGDSDANAIKEISKTIYQKAGYDTTTVEKGDIEPIISLTLTPEVVETIDYTVDEENLEVDEILVSAGDSVTAGQVLVTFKAEEIRKSIEKYRSEVEKNQLLLDHYTRLANVDKKQDYTVEIEKLTDNVNLANLYLEEELQRLNNCSIIAKQDGIVSYISKVLLDGYVAPSTCMVTEICGEGTYYVETSDNYDFKIGDVFTAENDTMDCDMKVNAVEEGELRKIIFEPSSDLLDASGTETFTLTIKKSSLKNVVFVNKKAINEKDGKNFVYIVSENGFLDVAYVEIGEQVDDMIVIKSGLSGGEEVALK